MPYLVVFIVFLALTGTLGLHITTEAQFIRRINKATKIIQKLLDDNNQDHIDLKESAHKSSLARQVRILEYYLHTLDPNFVLYSQKKSIFKRMERIEQAIMEMTPNVGLELT